MSNTEQYEEYFTKGLKLTVVIPMENSEIFRDWAVVVDLNEDMLTLQLSRDVLPSSVRLEEGTELDLRIGQNSNGYRCSAVFVSFLGTGLISLRLTGNITTSELREFFRINLFLSIRYEGTNGGNLEAVLAEWRTRREKSSALLAERMEEFERRRKEYLFRLASGEIDEESRDEAEVDEFNPVDESWESVNGTAVNVSGGGLRFVTVDKMKMDELLFLEIMVPVTPPRVMETVGRVVFTQPNLSFRDEEEHFNVAVQFIFIDERDRDALVQHIANIEALRIRCSRQLPLVSYEKTDRISYVKTGVSVIILVALFFYGIYFIYTKLMNSTNEIQDNFQYSLEKMIRK